MRAIAVTLASLLVGLVVARPADPVVSAGSAIVMDQTTGRVLWSKEPDTPRYPASTTKILTALLLLEHTRPHELLRAPEDVESVTGASLHLKPGETVTAQDALYAIMLRSANDVCHTIAAHIAGDCARFSALMNMRARDLGAQRTHFVNPHGLNDYAHITTARDLAVIARAAMDVPEFARVAGTERRTIDRSVNLRDRWLVSKNKFLEADPTATGVKTGWTVPAGKCFVGSADRGGMRIVTVVLKSEDWLKDTQTLTEWAYASYRPGRIVERGQPLGERAVTGGESERVALVAAHDVYGLVPVSGGDDRAAFTDVPARLEAPIKAGQVLGLSHFTDAAGDRVTVPAVAATAVAGRSTIAGLLFTPSGFLTAGLLFGGALWMRRRARRFAPRPGPVRR